MIDPDLPLLPEPEVLNKVLPAGGPIAGAWACPTCGHVYLQGCPPKCGAPSFLGNPGPCPIAP